MSRISRCLAQHPLALALTEPLQPAGDFLLRRGRLRARSQLIEPLLHGSEPCGSRPPVATPRSMWRIDRVLRWGGPTTRPQPRPPGQQAFSLTTSASSEARRGQQGPALATTRGHRLGETLPDDQPRGRDRRVA